MWKRREISASSCYDRSHDLHPHPYLQLAEREQDLRVQLEETEGGAAAGIAGYRIARHGDRVSARPPSPAQRRAAPPSGVCGHSGGTQRAVELRSAAAAGGSITHLMALRAAVEVADTQDRAGSLLLPPRGGGGAAGLLSAAGSPQPHA
jgi:hypothetical protein